MKKKAPAKTTEAKHGTQNAGTEEAKNEIELNSEAIPASTGVDLEELGQQDLISDMVLYMGEDDEITDARTDLLVLPEKKIEVVK